MLDQIRNYLYEPRVRGVDVDDNRLLDIHRQVLLRKPLLKSAFETFYRDMADLSDRLLAKDGLEVELGTGAGFFKSIRPQLITSDIRRAPNIDMELDAQAMSFKSETVRCVYAINVFHHLPDPDLFFRELMRVLVPGGGCVLVEPHAGFASASLHRKLHVDEHFDPEAPGWTTAAIGGPLSGANQALSHIVFERDRKRFDELYGSTLNIVHRGYELNALRYLLSGGLNFRQLVPGMLGGPIRLLERLGKPVAKHWSLHQATVIQKRAC
jgi:SAM-dependent methyltransferase